MAEYTTEHIEVPEDIDMICDIAAMMRTLGMAITKEQAEKTYDLYDQQHADALALIKALQDQGTSALEAVGRVTCVFSMLSLKLSHMRHCVLAALEKHIKTSGFMVMQEKDRFLISGNAENKKYLSVVGWIDRPDYTKGFTSKINALIVLAQEEIRELRISTEEE